MKQFRSRKGHFDLQASSASSFCKFVWLRGYFLRLRKWIGNKLLCHARILGMIYRNLLGAHGQCLAGWRVKKKKSCFENKKRLVYGIISSSCTQTTARYCPLILCCRPRCLSERKSHQNYAVIAQLMQRDYIEKYRCLAGNIRETKMH